MVQGFTFSGDNVVESGKFVLKYYKEYGSGGNIGTRINTNVGVNSTCAIDVAFRYATKTFAVYVNGLYIGECSIPEEHWVLDGLTLRIGTESYSNSLNE